MSIQPSNRLVDTETPVALTGVDFMPGTGLVLVAGGGHEVLHLSTSNVTSIALAGESAIVATYPNLVIMSLTQPETPVVVGTIPKGGWPGYLRAADGRVVAAVHDAGDARSYVYLPRIPRGFDVVDVRNAAAPVAVARHREAASASRRSRSSVRGPTFPAC
jgi:hypothetical protein